MGSSMFKTMGLMVAVVLAVMLIAGGIQFVTADFRGVVDKREKINADGGYRIAAYEEFYKLCSTVQAKNDEIGNLEAAVDSASDVERKAELEGAILAQRNTKAELVREYNAKAAAEGTRGQFRDSELPYEIDSNQEDVQCGTA